MEIIEVLREARKLVVDTIGPETLRIDPLPTGTFLSCGDDTSDIIMGAKLHSPIQGLNEAIGICSPKALALIFDSPNYSGNDGKVCFVPSGAYGRYFQFSNALGHVTQMKLVGGGTLDAFAKKVRTDQLPTQLVMPVTALWKQQLEYWSKFDDENLDKAKASFVVHNNKLSCLVGDYNFDYHIWHCESGAASGFVSAVMFPCLPMIKVLRLFPHVRRMSISVTTQKLLVIKAEGHKADYTFFIRGKVPHWYDAASLPVYDIDDPRSVMQQRQDES